MMTQNKTQQNDGSVDEFINLLDDKQVVADCRKIMEIIGKASGHEPTMWGPSIIGFDSYHYKYASGREGDAPVLAFSPRKAKLTIYVDEGSESRVPELYAALGVHTKSKVCIYIKRLSDIDTSVLLQILQESYRYTKSQDKSQEAA